VKIGVVLDSTAISAYARLDGVAVGELIATVHDDGDVAAVPVLALVDVWPELDADARVIVTELVSRDGGPVVVLPLHLMAVPAVAAHADRIGHGAAQAVAAARELGATLATYAPERYLGLVDPYDLLSLS
jgi:hypothetical protein